MPAAVDRKRELVDPDHPHLSISRQCELLDLNRSTYYLPPATESEENLRLMRLIDEQYLKTPFYGSRRMTVFLVRRGEAVNRKRVRRLMAIMGLEALHPKPRTTVAEEGLGAVEELLLPLADLDRVDLIRLGELGGGPGLLGRFQGDLGLERGRVLFARPSHDAMHLEMDQRPSISLTSRAVQEMGSTSQLDLENYLKQQTRTMSI